MKRQNLLALAAVLITGTALAHTALAHNGVQNAAVKARMDAMSGIGAEMKVLGLMAKGTNAFDLEVARASARLIAEHAAATPGLFKAEETDPKSEAKPSIWTNFKDFTTIANELNTVATGLSKTIEKQEDLRSAMANLGATCKSCHSAYRQ